MPLTELWNHSGLLDARRFESVGETDIARLLRDGSTFVVADVGLPLQWISVDDRFAYWKQEVKCRLVPSNADTFDYDEYPGSYCYVATKWKCVSLAPIILLEKYH